MDLFRSGWPHQRIDLTALGLLEVWESENEKLDGEQKLRFLKDAENSNLLIYSDEILHLVFRITPKFAVACDYLEVIGAEHYDQTNRYSEEDEDLKFEVSEDVVAVWETKLHEESNYFLWL